MAKISEVDKRLTAHELACEQRWIENHRRLDAIEEQLMTLNQQIRIALTFLVVALGSFFFATIAF